MCESNVFFKRGDDEELLMRDVAVIEPVGGSKFVLKGLLGERTEVSGKIETIDLMGHKIIFTDPE